MVMKRLFLTGIAALFLATGTAQAGAEEYFLATCLRDATPRENVNDCATVGIKDGLEACKNVRQYLLKENMIVSRCTRTEEEAKAELANVRWN